MLLVEDKLSVDFFGMIFHCEYSSDAVFRKNERVLQIGLKLFKGKSIYVRLEEIKARMQMNIQSLKIS